MRVLIDTNLLVLLIVGSACEDYIAVHRRTRAYTADDFVLLQLLAESATVFVTTPHVLAETSNLIRHFDEARLAGILDAFRDFVGTAAEIFIPSAAALASEHAPRLGLNDVTVLNAQDVDVTLITDDLDLYLTSAMAGRKVINFTHERARVVG